MGFFFNDEPTHLGYRDLNSILAGKSTILILICMFPWSESLDKNINSLNPSRWHVVIKCNFPFFQESLIANSFLPLVVYYGIPEAQLGLLQAYLAACAMLSVLTRMVSGFLQTWPVTNSEGLSCSSLPQYGHFLMGPHTC